jgi:hypothetical protein
MRAVVGLDHPTRGETRVSRRRYAEHSSPMRVLLCGYAALTLAAPALMLRRCDA